MTSYTSWPHARWPNFRPEEMRCSHCGALPADSPEFEAFMDVLQRLRARAQFPFTVSSGYRCPTYNDELYGAHGDHRDGPHTKGAADILVSFERAYALAAMAFAEGMGVGLRQHGPADTRFIHLDNQGRRLWTYT